MSEQHKITLLFKTVTTINECHVNYKTELISRTALKYNINKQITNPKYFIYMGPCIVN